MSDQAYVPFLGFGSWADLPVRDGTWARYLDRLNRLRQAVPPADVELAIRRSILAAALNTGAIEGLHGASRGLTITVIEHVLDWEPHVRASEGSAAAEHVAAAIASLDLALDAATQGTQLTEAWVRTLHETACAAQDYVSVVVELADRRLKQEQPLSKGAYKKAPNHVELPGGGVHAYCPVADVPSEMSRLITELNDTQFAHAHPALQAAYAHHALVAVHPFQDGNGRVARALASVFLLRAASIPMLIYPDQQAWYFDALAEADAGTPLRFLRFVEDRAVDLMALASDLVLGSGRGSPTVTLPVGRVPEATIEAAHRLGEVVEEELRSVFDQMVVSEGVEATFETMGYNVGSRDNDGRRTVVESHPMVVVKVPRYGLRAERWLAVFAATSPDDEYALVIRANRGDHVCELRLSDVYPEISTSARLRVSAFASRTVHDATAEIQELLEAR